MPKTEDIRHSILIVSASEQFGAIIRKSLRGFLMIDFRKSVAAARRCILERYYDIIVVDMPMPDELGEQFAADITEQCDASILLIAPAEIYEDVLEQVTDLGILAVSKPFPRGRIDKALRFLVAIQNKRHLLEKKLSAMEGKMEEMRIVNKAKCLLVEKRRMTEDEAHRLIGKQAMDNGVTRKRVAERIIEDFE